MPLFPSMLLGAFALFALTPPHTAHAVVPEESAGVVVSIAIDAGVLQPGEFPVAGRDCNAVLSQLRTKEGFAGRIRGSYEPPADQGRCFNLEGKEARVAVVCCAPRTEP